MPRAGFELAIQMFERPKTVLDLDRAAVETGLKIESSSFYSFIQRQWKILVMRTLTICTHRQILLGLIKSRRI